MLLLSRNIIQYYVMQFAFEFQSTNIFPCQQLDSIIFYTMSNKFKYNPFRIPSSLTLAQEHRAATSTGTLSQNQQLCACCLLPTKKIQLPINFDMTHLSNLSPQYRSLYDYLKISAIIILLILFDSGISQFQDAILVAESTLNLQQSSWTSLSPTYPQSKFWMYSSLSFISLLIFLIAARVIQSYRLNRLLNASQGQEYWAVLLKNTPKGPNVEQNIRDLFKTNFNDIQIREIILLSDMTKYSEAKQQISKEVNNWRSLLQNEEKKKQEILVSLKNIQSAHKNLNKVREQLSVNKNENFCGNSIVVFEKRQDQQQVLKAWKSKFFTKNKIGAAFGEAGISDTQIMMVQEAPSPSEIEWENISLPNSFSHTKARMNYIFMFLLQVLIFLFYFTTQLCIGRKIGEAPQKNAGTVPTLLILSIVSYGLLPFLLQILQQREKSYSLTKRNSQMTNKIAFSFFLIRSLTIFVVESVFVSGQDLAMLALDKIVIFTFCDLFVGLAYWLVNPRDLVKRIFIKISAKKNKLTQQQLNKLYERPNHDISFKFGFVLFSFWTAIFYSNLAPIIILIQLFSIVAFYWIDKLNFARRSSVNMQRTSGTYLQMIHDSVEIGLVLKPLANLVFWSIAKQTMAVPQIIMLMVGIAYHQAPKERFVSWVLGLIKLQIKVKVFDYCQDNFNSIYRLENPITGNLAGKVTWIQSRGAKVKINNNNSQLSGSIDGQQIQGKIEIGQRQNDQCKQDQQLPNEQYEVEQMKQTDRKMVDASGDDS